MEEMEWQCLGRVVVVVFMLMFVVIGIVFVVVVFVVADGRLDGGHSAWSYHYRTQDAEGLAEPP